MVCNQIASFYLVTTFFKSDGMTAEMEERWMDGLRGPKSEDYFPKKTWRLN